MRCRGFGLPGPQLKLSNSGIGLCDPCRLSPNPNGLHRGRMTLGKGLAWVTGSLLRVARPQATLIDGYRGPPKFLQPQTMAINDRFGSSATTCLCRPTIFFLITKVLHKYNSSKRYFV
ncbi:hypothetical protein EUGRSUZ_J02900 [Eucalyptus grandis]|uniref:Uncharacterized protein n=2 Tax=Eucalyptus grandis TaxID=71139 RepID=A0ACC3JCH5_EUCGR|nr:hypothetical protein EUGRSUZ_J02900 [Eucalyptus grandis]